MIEVAVNADRAKHGVRFASGAVHVKTAGDKAVNHVLDLGVGGPFLHYDDHKLFSVLLRLFFNNRKMTGLISCLSPRRHQSAWRRVRQRGLRQ